MRAHARGQDRIVAYLLSVGATFEVPGAADAFDSQADPFTYHGLPRGHARRLSDVDVDVDEAKGANLFLQLETFFFNDYECSQKAVAGCVCVSVCESCGSKLSMYGSCYDA
jgi:hypothetical protein